MQDKIGARSFRELDSLNEIQPLWVRAVTGVSVCAAGAGGALCLAMAVGIAASVVGRQVGVPINDMMDVVTYLLMPAIAVLALGQVHLRDQHVQVSVVMEAAPLRTRRGISMVTQLITGLVAGWVAILILDEALYSYEIGDRATVAPWLPIWAGRFAVAAAWLILTGSIVARFYQSLRERPSTKQESSEEPLTNA
ncbi:TRAP transporter small permease (plasmid) [Rhodococcus sp. USK10]|uniref:TRAP transporter small permease subunit n=1 Tax=Rhodococcus sp. USK10 TaxID=2789739 RepID=UPI001C5DFAF7|nr:TRAP transporter small permease subunit [Rhodococcus sp. USK10]QYA99754.1 TRAP transporter small permease [Rhodococcus sp. USK10]